VEREDVIRYLTQCMIMMDNRFREVDESERVPHHRGAIP